MPARDGCPVNAVRLVFLLPWLLPISEIVLVVLDLIEARRLRKQQFEELKARWNEMVRRR
jgi:hypothetical protein